jgi:hypothetical protein
MIISPDMGNDHLGFVWHLLRSSQEIYAISTQIRKQFDPGIWKPPCAEAILWDPNFSEYHLLHNELSKAILLRGHEQKLRAKNHYTYSQCRERGSFVVTFTALPGVPTTQPSPGKAIVPLLMSSAKAYSTIQSYFDEPLLEYWSPMTFTHSAATSSWLTNLDSTWSTRCTTLIPWVQSIVSKQYILGKEVLFQARTR